MKKRITNIIVALVTILLFGNSIFVQQVNAEFVQKNNIASQEMHSIGSRKTEYTVIDVQDSQSSDLDVQHYSSSIRESDRAYWGKFTSKYYYNLLTDEEKYVWNELEEKCLAAAVGNETFTKISADSYLTYDNREQWGIFVGMFRDSHPQYYFLENSFSAKRWGNQYQVSLKVYPVFQNGDIRAKFTQAFTQKVNSWVDIIDKYEYDEQKEKAAVDIIAQNTIYLEGNYDQSAFSLVYQGATVCSGYALTFSMLMNAVGLESIVAVNEMHAWNLIKLHGSWYEVDMTWLDQDKAYNSQWWKYYNKSHSTILAGDTENEHQYGDYSVIQVPETKYDSPSGDWDYVSHYFNSDSFTYFVVNSGKKGQENLVLPVAGQKGVILPNTVMYNNISYNVIGGGLEYGFMFGDANGDKQLNISDCVVLKKHLAGYKVIIDKKASDVNCDGLVNISDVVMILKKCAGQDIVFGK